MELLASDFNELLAGIGQRCEWRRSFACPCGSNASGSGAADKTCPHCTGFGHLWEDPIESVVGKTGSDVRKKWAQFGQYDDGDTVVTIGSDQAAYGIAAFDRVLMLDQTEPFSMKLVPGVNTRITFPILSVEKVLVIGADGSLKSLGLPDVNQLGQLVWPTGKPLTAYSITGRRPVEFYAWTNQPFDRPHELGEPLPRRIVLRRFDLYGRSA